jgi:hypothetical protein
VQDSVGPLVTFRHLLDGLRCGKHKELDLAPASLSLHILHDWQSAAYASADHQPPAFPGNLLGSGKRCVAVGVSEGPGLLLFPLPYAPTIDQDVVPMGDSVDLNRAELEAIEAHPPRLYSPIHRRRLGRAYNEHLFG